MNALKKALAPNPSHLALQFRTACQSDDALWSRVQPLAGLVRLDNFGYPVVIPTGSVFVTAGTDRRSSGTHYTPRVLTEPIVQYTLEPLVYVGPAEGWPKSEWKLKSAKELLELKICDMACGSGAFLVQVCRYLSARLLEAWDEEEGNHGRLGRHGKRDMDDDLAIEDREPVEKPLFVNMVTGSLAFSDSVSSVSSVVYPMDVEERRILAMRMIAQRCIYGVDINPLAVEMCKLSL